MNFIDLHKSSARPSSLQRAAVHCFASPSRSIDQSKCVHVPDGFNSARRSDPAKRRHGRERWSSDQVSRPGLCLGRRRAFAGR
jgi:hypothetical protein